MITSTSNPAVKAAKKLLDKKYRCRERAYIVEGEKLIRDALRFGQTVLSVFCTLKSGFSRGAYDFSVNVAERFVMESLSDAVTPQNELAVVKMPDTAPHPPRGKCLILDGLQDPGNAGAIMRTAAATGYDEIYLAGCVDAFSPKVVRSAMSAHFAVKLFQGGVEEIFAAVKPVCQIICADMGGENVFGCKAKPVHALVIGNEGGGVSAYAKQNADKTVSLPMKNGMESLNAAVAAGVIMYLLGKEE